MPIVIFGLPCSRVNGTFGLLMIDERMLDKPDVEFRSMLLERMKLGYGAASTVSCTQFKKKGFAHPSAAGSTRASPWTVSRTMRSRSIWVRPT